jgi:hypothetical protein
MLFMISIGKLSAVMKASPVTTQLRHWLGGDVLLLAKASVWREVFATWMQQAVNGDRRSLYGSVVPPLLMLLGAIAFWHWNAPLLVAVLMGCVSSFLLYSMTQRSFSGHKIKQWLQSPNAPMVLSVGAGVGILLLSYSALAVWQDLGSPWLAMMLFTQEAGIFGALGLAVWLMLTRQNQPLHSFERCVAGLLHRDELRRLMAVRQLTALIVQGPLSGTERSHALDYLHLLAQKENSPVVGKAIQEGLGYLAPPQRMMLGDLTTLSARRIQSPPAAAKIRQEAMADVG